MPSLLPGSGLAVRLADPGAVLLLALKALRLLVQAGALYVAEKVFAQRLVRRVYGEGDNPPHLYGMLLTFMCLDATPASHGVFPTASEASSSPATPG
jgi:hypothetical protein